jgi:cobalt-zinc-cadmium efflux system protein
MIHRAPILRHQGHDHAGGHGHGHDHSGSSSRLTFAFTLTVAFLLVELATGLWTNSLALLSDAFHMLSDSLALGLAALAAGVSVRRPTAEKTYGFKRFEVLAAFTNALLLGVFGFVIAYHAVLRLWHPQNVHAEPMLLVAALGLALNLGIFFWIHRSKNASGGHSLNEEGVLWHVAGDALGSIAAIAAGAVMVWTGWMRADALAGLLTASVLLFGAQRVLRQSAHILVEGVPPGVDARTVRSAMESFPQVRAVHDLHLWTLSGRDLYLSAHLEVDDGPLAASEVAGALRRELEQRFGAQHITLQAGPCGPENCGNDCA